MKYLGLLAMSKILRTHPKSVQAHKDLVLQCLDDKDESIRLRALDLLYGMVRAHPATWPPRRPAPPLPHQPPPLQVSKKNLMEIVKKLMTHVDKAEGTTYRDELLTKIIDICSQSNYQHITNFEWCGPQPSVQAGGRAGGGAALTGSVPQVHQHPGGADPTGGHPPRPPHRRPDAGCGHPREGHPPVCRVADVRAA